jgi:hypothetical protein
MVCMYQFLKQVYRCLLICKVWPVSARNGTPHDTYTAPHTSSAESLVRQSDIKIYMSCGVSAEDFETPDVFSRAATSSTFTPI